MQTKYRKTILQSMLLFKYILFGTSFLQKKSLLYQDFALVQNLKCKFYIRLDIRYLQKPITRLKCNKYILVIFRIILVLKYDF